MTDAVRRIVTADRGDTGLRLDLVLRRHLTDVRAATRTRVQAWIEAGLVTVNGAPVRRVAARTAAGDVVAIVLPDAPHAQMAAEDIALRVLHEDDHLLAIDKPPGMVAHPAHRNPSGTLMNALLWHARGWPAPQRPSLVGRLDKWTSGIVLVARSAAVHAALQRTPASQATVKDYLAVVYGRVTVARGAIDLRLRRDPGDRRRVVASADLGAPSRTEFERLARVAAPAAGLTALRCRLITGRTHQIRVHVASRGWPLVGDAMYGEPRWQQVTDAALASVLAKFPRQALHAWRLTTVHPITNAPLAIEAPIPGDMRALMDAAGLALHRVGETCGLG